MNGADAAPGMVSYARDRLPRADIRRHSLSDLPWDDGQFDVVTAFNALQFAPDLAAGLAALVRVARPGGHVAVANWAEVRATTSRPWRRRSRGGAHPGAGAVSGPVTGHGPGAGRG